MKHVFIINPTAGKSDSRQKIYDMAEKLRQEHGLEVQCLLTKKQGHATEIARRLCQTGNRPRLARCPASGQAALYQSTGNSPDARLPCRKAW
mgnify:CR=1 FL=1